MTRMITLPEFLTDPQIQKVRELKTAKLICDEVIAPNLDEINRKLGQENDPMYLAYACEYVVAQLGGE